MEKNIELKENLLKNNFTYNEFDSVDELNNYLLGEISLKDSVSIGGSMTIEEIKIYDKLKERGNEVLWHWKNKDEDVLMRALDTDIYLTSTNAITQDGKIVNMDGTGNRVASMIFGHKKVYLIVGKNKICKDYMDAINRIENVAAPLNVKRLNAKTPCAVTGKCSDCNSPDRICKIETIIHKNPGGTNIEVCLVNQDLGY